LTGVRVRLLFKRTVFRRCRQKSKARNLVPTVRARAQRRLAGEALAWQGQSSTRNAAMPPLPTWRLRRGCGPTPRRAAGRPWDGATAWRRAPDATPVGSLVAREGSRGERRLVAVGFSTGRLGALGNAGRGGRRRRGGGTALRSEQLLV